MYVDSNIFNTCTCKHCLKMFMSVFTKPLRILGCNVVYSQPLAIFMLNQRFNTRSFSCSSCSHGKDNRKDNIGRQAKMLKKFMANSSKARKKFYTAEQHVSTTYSEFGFIDKTQKSKPVSGKVLRRVEVLNTIFIEHITSLLATGEVSPEFVGLGVQISKVKVMSNFKGVNVYWYCSGTEKDDKIETLLTQTAGHLRHILSSLRVIGVVPAIFFIKDNTYAKLQLVETELAKCDFGPDFKPTHPNKPFMTQPILKSKESTEDESENETYSQNVMRQDMLGVNRDRIMAEIKNSMKQQQERKLAKEKYRASIMKESELVHDDNPDSLENVHANFKETRDRQREFLKYLKQKQLSKAREIKRMSTETKNNEFYSSVKDEIKTNQLKNRLDELDGDDDDDDDSDDEDAEDMYEKEEEYYQQTKLDRS